MSLVALHAVGPSPGLFLLLSRILLKYNQLNVRTYVKAHTGSGIVLIDTQVDRILPSLGARLFGMPYRFTPNLDFKICGKYAVLNTPYIKGEIEKTSLFTPSKGSLESFLTDRFWVYARAPAALSMA